MTDAFDLQRFLYAQDGIYEKVLDELSSGRKTSHWMWYIFPQIAGLGSSPTSHLYAISNLGEARAYLNHDVLGVRLRECTTLMLQRQSADATLILGHIDAMKFRSSMTLFDKASDGKNVFRKALDRFYAGDRDEKTLELIGS